MPLVIADLKQANDGAIRLASCYYPPKLCLRTPASWISIRLNFLRQAETDRTTPIQPA